MGKENDLKVFVIGRHKAGKSTLFAAMNRDKICLNTYAETVCAEVIDIKNPSDNDLSIALYDTPGKSSFSYITEGYYSDNATYVICIDATCFDDSISWVKAHGPKKLSADNTVFVVTKSNLAIEPSIPDIMSSIQKGYPNFSCVECGRLQDTSADFAANYEAACCVIEALFRLVSQSQVLVTSPGSSFFSGEDVNKNSTVNHREEGGEEASKGCFGKCTIL